MKYDIKLVYSFIVFAESKNIVEAAGKLRLSQPALSAHLKAFEESFALPLFMIRGRKKVLSAFGQEMYQQLKDKLNGVDSLIEQTSLKFSTSNNAVVKAGGRREILTRVLRKLRFSGKLVAVECDSVSGLAMARRSEIDLLISTDKPDSLNLIAKPFFKDHFQILLPKKMKIEGASVSKKLVEQLARLPLLSYKENLLQLNQLRDHFSVTQPQEVFRVFEDWRLLIELCESGLGWTLAPTSFAFDESKCRVLSVSPEAVPGAQFYVIYPKSLAKTEWFLELVTEIRGTL